MGCLCQLESIEDEINEVRFCLQVYIVDQDSSSQMQMKKASFLLGGIV